MRLRLTKYWRQHEVTATDIERANWQRSSFVDVNGVCLEVARLSPRRIGVRDAKDHGSGPVLVFTNKEWDAFIRGAKNGQFDSILERGERKNDSGIAEP